MTLIDDGLLLDHASGAAPAALSALALAQAELRPEAARRLGLAEAALGALLESESPARLDPEARSRLLARLEDAPQDVPVAAPRRSPDDALPGALRAHLSGDGALDWRKRAGGRGEIRLETLCEPGVEAALIRLEPGRTIPRHDHGGQEYTLVLSGAFSDERALYRRGDVCTGGPGETHTPRVEGETHTPRVEGEETCICLIVSLGRMKFENPLIALYDRFLAKRS